MVTITEIIKIRWKHLSKRNAEIMARWELGECYTHIAFCMRDQIKSRACICGVVARNRDDGHVVKPRGPLRVPRGLGEGDCDGHMYGWTPIKGNRQDEVDQAIESRARLLAALHV